MSVQIITAAGPPSAISIQGLVTYLQSLFGPLFLGIVGIVALFFLFTREITRFVQSIVLAVAIAVVLYTPVSWTSPLLRRQDGISNATGSGAFWYGTARNRNVHQKRLSEMNTAQPFFALLGEAATVLATLTGLLWWVFRQGRKAGKEEARREAVLQAQADAAAKVILLEARLMELEAELDSMRSRRRRV